MKKKIPLLNDTVRCSIAETKSPNRSVPSFRMYRKIKMARTSLLSWKPTSSKASRSLSAFNIPVFSFVWLLKAVCQYFRLHIRSLKSLNCSLPVPVVWNEWNWRYTFGKWWFCCMVKKKDGTQVRTSWDSKMKIVYWEIY